MMYPELAKYRDLLKMVKKLGGPDKYLKTIAYQIRRQDSWKTILKIAGGWLGGIALCTLILETSGE